ncbi:thermonuclease family protein [Sphingomonas sp. LY54]|uniref:thermonuclease family protein n=1 Tax=Sphingomonas sp. LY54 TaxID=3095343 RepID=UPI002D78F0ED|nr:thermonuclease family protein [Sphingomonas sp. LY54]WRP27296.1 thermonuclease family protein [Sphingomonas sp. LY54]
MRRPKTRPAGRRAARRPRFAWPEIRLMLVVGVLGGLAYAGFDSGRAGVPSGDAAIRIVDGDTFWLGEDKIRVADIDTPEVRGRCPEESALAARATRRMEALLNEGPFELHRVDRDEDRYGRKLRVVTRDGRSLGDRLVAEGLARTWTGRREPWCA